MKKEGRQMARRFPRPDRDLNACRFELNPTQLADRKALSFRALHALVRAVQCVQ